MRKILSVLMMICLCGTVSFAQKTTTKKKTMNGKKVLVAFFSHTGENYNVGNITKGNTHIIAEMIAGETGGKLFQIDPVKPYPDKYTPCVEVAKKEKEANARPAIKGDIAAEGYDIIFIGYPNWWGDMPMAVYTFIEKHKWQGKTVIPFCTHEGSGLSGTDRQLAKVCKGATIGKGFALKGTIAQNSRAQALKAVKAWISKM